ncbi:MAG: ATP-dependent DNA helicase RecG [Butyrivibrio sp.]|nr:ATP-dependent DNA helicase RecG [Butyrivibrio sp.]
MKSDYLRESIASLKGIGDKTQKLFEKCDVHTISDLMFYYPRDYEKFEEIRNVSDVTAEEIVTVKCAVIGTIMVKHVRNLSIINFEIADKTGKMSVTYFNMPYLKNSFKSGKYYIFRGLVKKKGNSYILEQPKTYKEEEYQLLKGSLQPKYPLVKGLSNNAVIKAVKQVMMETAYLEEYLTDTQKDELQVMDYANAIRHIHFPENSDDLMKARKRLAFDEFFEFILRIKMLKTQEDKSVNNYIINDSFEADILMSRLPFKLTGKQEQIWNDIKNDLSGKHVMNRLIQGDVGSGKTILAFLALLMVCENGYQSAIMAPTEVLARQHYEGFVQMIEQYGLRIKPVLLTGSITGKAKKEAQQLISEGYYNLIVGTNALIQEKVEYKNLALVITDEQHRFGVRQREKLADKGDQTHVLAMSATPIPRTLAIILYGDLNISILDELPAGRIPIKNCVVGTNYRPTAYKFISGEVQKGHQAYVICPMVEEGELDGVENVTDYAEKLKASLPSNISVGVLHGKMKPSEKDEIMEAFAANKIQVLVSTTVIEVGINVPNATVMMIENAERFGLSQLHQLRGRVGRGKAQSYCIFINTSEKDEAKKRLETMNNSNDGFVIAEEDLKQRGPGDLFGVRQSGEMNFKVADIYTDSAYLKKAAAFAEKILKKDPDLSLPEDENIKKFLDERNHNMNIVV